MIMSNFPLYINYISMVLFFSLDKWIPNLVGLNLFGSLAIAVVFKNNLRLKYYINYYHNLDQIDLKYLDSNLGVMV